MTWREDRDALIAQTMAFVQSVTGKQVDFAQFALPPAPPAAGVVEPASSEPVAATFVAGSQQPRAEAGALASNSEPGKFGPSNAVQNGTPLSNPITVRPGAVLPAPPDAVQTPLHTSGAFGTEPFTSIAGRSGCSGTCRPRFGPASPASVPIRSASVANVRSISAPPWRDCVRRSTRLRRLTRNRAGSVPREPQRAARNTVLRRPRLEPRP